mgnify:CR=1 FL=1
MDQRCYFKLKGGLNFLCAAAGISLLTNAVIKLCKYGEKEAERKEAVEAVKTIDELMKNLIGMKQVKLNPKRSPNKGFSFCFISIRKR